MVVILSLAVGIVLVPTWSYWLWFILYRPEKWAAFVNRENAWWVKRGVVPKRVAAAFQSLETGPVMKMVVAAGILMGAMLILYPPLVHR